MGNVHGCSVHFHTTRQTPEPHVSVSLLQPDPGMRLALLPFCGRHLPEQVAELGAEIPVQPLIS